MRFDFLVYIGRFQPFHNGHLAMLQQALAQAEQVIVVLGSARSARNTRNPFTAAERKQMIQASMGEPASRLQFVELRDYYDDARWAEAARKAVAAVVPSGATVGLFGHFKDRSSAYLSDFPGWPLLEAGNYDGLNAADLRSAWFEAGGAVTTLRDKLPAPVGDFLEGFAQGPEFIRLREEHDYLADYRVQWSRAPYPPVFVTVDAVVSCCEHVLLVQRGGQPGRGCWALPGGFLDQHERVAEASIRELLEETCLAVPEATLRASRVDQALFDQPTRSARGRTVTHAFHYRLTLPQLPAISAADDAAAAQWVPISRLVELETQMLDDHFMILDHFLRLLEA